MGNQAQVGSPFLQEVLELQDFEASSRIHHPSVCLEKCRVVVVSRTQQDVGYRIGCDDDQFIETVSYFAWQT